MNFFQRLVRLPFDFSNTYHQRMEHITHPGSMSDLNMPIGNTPVYATDSGSLVSVIKILGTKHYVTDESHQECIRFLNENIRQRIKSKDIEMCWVHIHDDDEPASREVLEAALKPSRSVSAIQGLQNKSFFAEQVEILLDSVQSEKTYLCLWTNYNKNKVGKISKIPEKKALGVQDTIGLKIGELLFDEHITRVKVIQNRMESSGILTELLSNSEMAIMLANMLDKESNANFMPRFFGHISKLNKFTKEEEQAKYTIRTPQNVKLGIKGEDYSVVFPPRLGHQLWRSNPVSMAGGVKIGNIIYGSLMVTLTPDGSYGFNSLVADAGRAGVPFRIAMKMNSDTRGMVNSKYVLANLLSSLPMHGENKTLRDAISQMFSLMRRGRTLLSVQMTLTTWDANPDNLRRKLSSLQAALGSWGAQSVFMSDDPLQGAISTLPPYTKSNPAPPTIGPSEEILDMTPITRPALPWKTGSMLFISKTGKLMPFQPMSNLMAHHVYLVAGEPGYGKSLACANILIALVESQDRLPYMAVSDVGKSSKGFIDYLISILPASEKHKVEYYSMQNSREYAINMADTPLGMRFPPEDTKAFIIEMLLLGVSSGSEKGETIVNVRNVLSGAVELAYQRKADSGPRSEPARFQETHTSDRYWNSVIQPALDKIDIELDEDVTYWALVDALYDAGSYRAAIMIQRFAMPLLRDIADAALEKNSLSNTDMGGGISYSDYIYSQLNLMYSEYEIMQVPTQLDLANTKVVAFNLEDVCLSNNDFNSQRKGTIFFGLTSRLQANKFFWNKERLKEIPEKYRPFHDTVISEIQETRNFYFADEQQRFSSFPMAVKIPETIASEGRKRGVGVMLASQRPIEFSDRMVELSTARFLVGFSKSSIKGVVDRFSLDSTEEALLSSQITMPTSEGSKMVVQFETEKGTFSQFVRFKVGRKRLWGLSTKDQSAMLREKVVEEFGYEAALGILAKLYPQCQIEDHYEELKVIASQGSIGRSGLERIDGKVAEDSKIMDKIIKDTIQKGRDYFVESLEERIY
ncbi:MAG: intracellular multiplication protein IcmB [Oleiphilaceae bacterium]|jgi:intracellular multiplication protein IcmB